jgi:GNAT superfamily N-acetyltransferase
MSSGVTIRPANASDREAIAAFTEHTFDWGDYVADNFTLWLGQPGTLMVVAVDASNAPVAMSRARLVSPTEAWFHAARVRPDQRGRGIAGDMASVLCRWAADEGAIVGRLLIEDWNDASIRHVEKVGFRKVVTVVRATKPIGEASPHPDGNGGRRIPSRLRPRLAHAADAAPAYSSWSVGELGRHMRGLAGGRWTFARLTVDHLAAAAKAGSFWEIGGGWAVAESEGGELEAGWLETRPEDATELLRALIDMAVARGDESISVWLANVEWMVRSARLLSFGLEPMAVYATELGLVGRTND